MRTIFNIPLWAPVEIGRARVIASSILRASDERQPFCTALHGDVLVIDCTIPGDTVDPDILARAGVKFAYTYFPASGHGFLVTSHLHSGGDLPAWSEDRFILIDGTPLALSRTVKPEAAPTPPDTLTVQFERALPWQRVADLIVTAIETPCGDWISSIDNTNPAVREGEEADSIWYANPLYWARGFSAEIGHDDPYSSALASFCLNAESIARGLTVMAKYQPSQFADFLCGNEDAGTADTFLQCCVFADYVVEHGDVVYG